VNFKTTLALQLAPQQIGDITVHPKPMLIVQIRQERRQPGYG
jgi:hypothetical protein